MGIWLEQDLLYLIGMTSIFIACKHEEVKLLSISTVIKSLGHNKYSAREIFNMELKILQVIQFRVPKTTLYDEAIIKIKIL